MPPTSLGWARAWAVLTLVTVLQVSQAGPADATTPAPPLQEARGGAGAGFDGREVCGREWSPVTPPEVEVGWERNSSQVAVICPHRLRTFLSSLPSTPPPPPPPAHLAGLASAWAGGRGVLLNLTQLLQEGQGGQVVVDVEGCGCVGVAAGVPAWAEGLTFAIRGSLRLPPAWWVGGGAGLRDMWVRVNGGLGVGGVCQHLPPTLETLDLSYTPLGELVVGGRCAPPRLERLEAIRSAVTHVSLCTPALTTLYLNNNEVGGDMAWAGCEGGVGGVVYLHASHNHLTAASTCGWPGLATLELRGNWLTALDLTSCPPANLTSLTAARNYLAAAPDPLPPALLILDLSHNNLTRLPLLTRAMQEADFSYNSIARIGDGRFGRARKLHRLNLAHNHLKEIAGKDFHGLRKLHRLDLSHNRLESIAPSSFLPLRHLRHLHLHHNDLTHLDARVIHALSGHAHATLHNNPWACNCQMLAALTQLQACAECKHKRVALQCREREHLQEVSALLRTCLLAIQHTQGHLDESDEDYSEEQPDEEDESGGGAVLIVPSLVVLIVLAVSLALGYKAYQKHKRAIASTFSPFCRWCGSCSPSGGGNNNTHNHHQEASQLPTGELQDSDTETEM